MTLDTSVPQTNTTDVDKPLKMVVDAEHNGLRLAGCSLFLVSVIVIFTITMSLFPEAIILNVLAAMGGGALVAYGIEQILRRRWPSGRALIANQEQIALTKHDKIETTIDPQRQTNVLTWYFEVKRNTRVRKGWYVIGFALEQDGNYIPIYTFSPPETFEEMPLASHFKKLVNPKKQKEEKQSLRVAGEQRRLLEAERLRGMNGAEITLEQFQDLVQYLQVNFPTWMIDA